MKKGSVKLGADDEEGESESKVINQIFGRLQHPKNEVRYYDNIFFRLYLEAFFSISGCLVLVINANIIAFTKAKIWAPGLSVTNTPFKNDSPYGIMH